MLYEEFSKIFHDLKSILATVSNKYIILFVEVIIIF